MPSVLTAPSIEDVLSAVERTFDPFYGWRILNESGYRREMLIGALALEYPVDIAYHGELPTMIMVGRMVVTIDDSQPMRHTDLSEAPAVEVKGQHETETEAAIMAARRAKGTTRCGELADDVIDAATNFDRDVDEDGNVPLIDDYRMTRDGAWMYVRHPKLLDGIPVAFKMETGQWDIIDRKTLRGDLEQFMVRVHNAPAVSFRYHDPTNYAIAQCNALVEMMRGWDKAGKSTFWRYA
jgi:hypothetical protein